MKCESTVFLNRDKGANFMACASWKCSSTYWERFNKALLNATEASNVTKEDMMNDDNAIRGEVSNLFYYSELHTYCPFALC